MTPLMIIFIILLAGMIGFSIYERFAKDKLMSQLTEFMMTGQFDKFDKKFNSISAKLMIRPFNRDFMFLTRSIIKNDSDDVEKAFQRFEKVNLNTKQKEAVYSRGFYYYLAVNNVKKADEFYKLMKENDKESISSDMKRLYDVYVLCGTRYLKETLDELRTAPENEKAGLETLISKMYENTGDDAKAKEYAEQAKQRYESL